MKKHSTLLIIPSLLALLVVGCTKDSGHIRILAQRMASSKIIADPAQLDGSTWSWVVGEQIDLNGTPRTIAGTEGDFYLDQVSPLSEQMYAVYPATVSSGGNSVSVTNGAAAATVTIGSLAVNLLADGTHEVVFPMAATAEAGSTQLLFNHLTGGLQLTLAAHTACSLATVKVITYGDDAAAPVTLDGITYTTRWASQGPTTPVGTVGGIEGDYDVKYASEMLFTMQTLGSDGVAIPDQGSITFCVPVTVNSVNRLTVIGYAADGTQLFAKTKSLATQILVNHIYTVPPIQIN